MHSQGSVLKINFAIGLWVCVIDGYFYLHQEPVTPPLTSLSPTPTAPPTNKKVLITSTSVLFTDVSPATRGGGGGVLPIMDYKGRLRPKGVPFSGWRYIKG